MTNEPIEPDTEAALTEAATNLTAALSGYDMPTLQALAITSEMAAPSGPQFTTTGVAGSQASQQLAMAIQALLPVGEDHAHDQANETDDPPSAEDLAYLAAAQQEEEEEGPYVGLTMADVDPGAVADGIEADHMMEFVYDAMDEAAEIEAEGEDYAGGDAEEDDSDL